MCDVTIHQRYADVYTSRLTNLLQYPGDYRFYPQARLLPHQQTLPAVTAPSNE
jgi:hypothetical protein